jgi:hypothetical protein
MGALTRERPIPSWEVVLLSRRSDRGRARVMGRVRFQARDAAGARQEAQAALAARSRGRPGWSLGLLRSLTPNAPGTRLYSVIFARWEPREGRFVRRDVHEQDVWATDATAARRRAADDVQSLPGYVPAWRIRRVAVA